MHNKKASRLYAELLCRRRANDICHPPVKSHPKSGSCVVHMSSAPCPHEISTPKIFPVKQQSNSCAKKEQKRLRGMKYFVFFLNTLNKLRATLNHWGHCLTITEWSKFTARKRNLEQGNIFIGVCQEFCSQVGWGVCLSACLDTHTPCLAPPPDQTPLLCKAFREIRSMRGRYASYWNAILLKFNYHDFKSLSFVKKLTQSWQIWQNEIQDEKLK